MMRIHDYWEKLDINPAVKDARTSRLLTAEERQRIVRNAEQHPLPESSPRLLCNLLHELERHVGLFPVNQLVHSLQTATRALRDNASDELVFAGLIHDIGKVFSGRHHAEISAALVREHVSADVYRVIRCHPSCRPGARGMEPAEGVLGQEQEAWVGLACRFVADWDQPAFDPRYETLPLEYFFPLIDSICRRRGEPSAGS
jgi:predicted HD phosphohydrolase